MKIVVLDGGTLNPGDLSWEPISRLGELKIYNSTQKHQRFDRSLSADLLIVNKVMLDAALLKRLPRLKYIAVSATGYNNVDIAMCRQLNIKVSNVVNYGSQTVAQHVFALILSLTNRVAEHAQRVENGEWAKKQMFSFWDQPLVELFNKTIGIIGYGNIGKRVARIATGFEMKVLYHSKKAQEHTLGIPVTLDRLLEQSDFISLHTHLTPSNRNLVDAHFLEKMKSTAILINTARGGLVNEEDLRQALLNGKIKGAGLDVLKSEPPPADHPLLGLENCIITPHNAWASVEARTRMMEIVEGNIKSFIAGKPLNLIR